MKKRTFFGLALLLTLALWCCRTQRNTETVSTEISSDTELSDYLRSADVYMHGPNGAFHVEQAQLSHDTLTARKTSKEKPSRKQLLDLYTDHAFVAADTTGEQPVKLSKKELRKAVLHAAGDDDGKIIGLTIGLFILFAVIAFLLLIWLIFVLANASANAANNTTSGSNSGGSNSGSGNGNGSGSNSGCYVATMVYGSYDAPEVLVLRRFRDETLAHSAFGRAFIRWYYGWSPGFVKKYAHLRWLHRVIRATLDRFVRLLQR